MFYSPYAYRLIWGLTTLSNSIWLILSWKFGKSSKLFRWHFRTLFKCEIYIWNNSNLFKSFTSFSLVPSRSWIISYFTVSRAQGWWAAKSLDSRRVQRLQFSVSASGMACQISPIKFPDIRRVCLFLRLITLIAANRQNRQPIRLSDFITWLFKMAGGNDFLPR